MVRGSDVRDIAEVEKVSKGKVLVTLKRCNYQITQKQSHYDKLEVDELWIFVGKKSNRQWLIYAYHRKSGEIVAYVWGNRNIHTVKKLKVKLQVLGITFAMIANGTWDSFVTSFKELYSKKLASSLQLALKVIIVELGLGLGRLLSEFVISLKKLIITLKPLI